MTDYHAVDARLVEAERFREYLDTIPDDGETIAPTAAFCDRAAFFLGFPAGAIPPREGTNETDEEVILCAWFPCHLDPAKKLIPLTVNKGELSHGINLGQVPLEPAPAFLECPMKTWEGFQRLALCGEKELVDKVALGVAKLFKEYVESFA